ncbi:RNase_Zc3h12a domain-containing protein [Meloidogyne graminicola]|uniref:RNase_Zc3h12a domain-containing protein n=1 Tax=Meloidogyne graminicola TaxID=189291 RepID=A0A8S9ZAD0_9BILA|nr:RNase_Zc3h12a domain-containing protein [Meloidogyne graminicola]
MNERRSNSDGNNIQGCSKDADLLILSSDESCNEEDLPIENCFKRLAIIDTLNLIHHCALISPFAKIHNQFKCDAIAVLLLARNLLKEIFLYDGINREKVANHFILEEMQKAWIFGNYNRPFT